MKESYVRQIENRIKTNYYLSSVVIEGARTLFFKYILENKKQQKATKRNKQNSGENEKQQKAT